MVAKKAKAKPKKYVYYTGIGAKTDGKHTPAEFIKIMKEFTAGSKMYPGVDFNKYTLDQWLVFSGAELRN
jgi:hypothetical protein